jgi:hypothetical protein
MADVQTVGMAVDERQVELQIRVVLVTYQVERHRRDASTMEAFRARARSILGTLDAEVRDDPDLAERLREARQQLETAAEAGGRI